MNFKVDDKKGRPNINYTRITVNDVYKFTSFWVFLAKVGESFDDIEVVSVLRDYAFLSD